MSGIREVILLEENPLVIFSQNAQPAWAFQVNLSIRHEIKGLDGMDLGFGVINHWVGQEKRFNARGACGITGFMPICVIPCFDPIGVEPVTVEVAAVYLARHIDNEVGSVVVSIFDGQRPFGITLQFPGSGDVLIYENLKVNRSVIDGQCFKVG